eukprot:1185672-Prorocentrum_minimum.AAC.1
MDSPTGHRRHSDGSEGDGHCDAHRGGPVRCHHTFRLDDPRQVRTNPIWLVPLCFRAYTPSANTPLPISMSSERPADSNRCVSLLRCAHAPPKTRSTYSRGSKAPRCRSRNIKVGRKLRGVAGLAGGCEPLAKR